MNELGLGKCPNCGRELPGEFPIHPDLCDECYKASQMYKKVSEDIYDYKHRLRHTIARLVFKPCMCDICTKGPFVESPFYIFSDGAAHECPDFPNDINACFTYIIRPELWICEMKLVDGIFFKWRIACPRYKGYGEAIGEEPALAFCEAVELLLKEGN